MYKELSVSSNDSDEVLDFNENLNKSQERQEIAETALKNFKEKQVVKRSRAILIKQDALQSQNVLPLLAYGRMATHDTNSVQNNMFQAYNTFLMEDNQEKELLRNRANEKTSYLKTLQQNQQLDKDTVLMEDIQKDRKVFCIKTNDFFTFMRLEHEISEIKRKDREFQEMKKHYFDQMKNNNQGRKDDYSSGRQNNDLPKESIKNSKGY